MYINLFDILRTKIINNVYPVGSIYQTISPQSPALLFKIGLWKKIENCFLIGCSTNRPAGTIGGTPRASFPVHTHTVSNFSHTHAISSHTHGIGIQGSNATADSNSYLITGNTTLKVGQKLRAESTSTSSKYHSMHMTTTSPATLTNVANVAASSESTGSANMTLTCLGSGGASLYTGNLPPYYTAFI